MSSFTWLASFLAGPAVIGIIVALLRARHAKRGSSSLRDLLSVALSALLAMLAHMIFGLAVVIIELRDAGDYGAIRGLLGVLLIGSPVAAFAAAITHMIVLARRDSRGQHAGDSLDTGEGSG